MFVPAIVRKQTTIVQKQALGSQNGQGVQFVYAQKHPTKFRRKTTLFCSKLVTLAGKSSILGAEWTNSWDHGPTKHCTAPRGLPHLRELLSEPDSLSRLSSTRVSQTASEENQHLLHSKLIEINDSTIQLHDSHHFWPFKRHWTSFLGICLQKLMFVISGLMIMHTIWWLVSSTMVNRFSQFYSSAVTISMVDDGWLATISYTERLIS